MLAQQPEEPDPDAGVDAILPRLVQAAVISAQIEAGRFGRGRRAAFRLREIAETCARYGGADAAAELTGYAARLDRPGGA
jgi:hypothetical protein